MPDPRLESVARRGEDAIVRDDFAAVSIAGHRLRRRQQTAVGLVGAAAVAAAVLAVSASRGSDASPQPTNRTPSVIVPTTRNAGGVDSAYVIVHDARSDLFELAVSADDPGTRATLWGLCSVQHQGCQRTIEAVAVTDDDFHTARYFRTASPSAVVWAGADRFVIQTGQHAFAVVGASSGVQRVTLSGPTSPLSVGEVLVTGSGSPPFAVDPTTGAAHPVPLPAGVRPGLDVTATQQGLSRTVMVVDESTSRVEVSKDGGASWGAPLTVKNRLVYPILSGHPGELAVDGEGDDGVLLPGDLFRSDDGGVSWQPVSAGPLARSIGAWFAVTPSGTLLADVYDDFGPGSGKGVAPGLYRSHGSDWTRFDQMAAVGFPHLGGDLLASVVDGAGHQSLYVTTFTGRTPGLAVSTDEGGTWEPVTAR